jgi:hypothetical protein
MGQLLLSAVVSAAFAIVTGLVTGVLGSFIGFHLWPALRRWRIRTAIALVGVPYSKRHALTCRVVNGSDFAIGKMVAYISIDHKVDDVVAPPEGMEAHILPSEGIVLINGQLCWAVQDEEAKNPMRVDICAGEEHPLLLARFHENCVEIFSERLDKPSRVFLARKRYSCSLKLVCMDCRAKDFGIEIDPDRGVRIGRSHAARIVQDDSTRPDGGSGAPVSNPPKP